VKRGREGGEVKKGEGKMAVRGIEK